MFAHCEREFGLALGTKLAVGRPARFSIEAVEQIEEKLLRGRVDAEDRLALMVGRTQTNAVLQQQFAEVGVPVDVGEQKNCMRVE